MIPADVGQAPPPDIPEGGTPTAGGGCPTLPVRGRLRRALPALAFAAVCFAAAVGFQIGADRARSADRGASVLYLPNEHLLKYATAGLNTVIADFLWLHCIQYVAIENRAARNFTWLETMVFTVGRLDPHFKDAFRYGAMFLSALKADAVASSNLLHIGIPENPRAWELPYELGMNYLMNRKNEPDARRYAAYYLGMSASTGLANEFVAVVAAKLQSENNLDNVETDMWLNMRESPDEVLRELAERKLKEMEIRKLIPILNGASAEYHKLTGRWPETIDDLKAVKIVDGDPPEPLGGHYFFGPDGKALNTTLLDNEKKNQQGVIEQSLRDFQDKKDRWPASLDELVKEGMLSKIPENPYPGKGWKYDPATGEVE